MNDAQRHRGPDGEGYYIHDAETRLWLDGKPDENEPGHCALAHRRLAILDPAGGRQPMVSSDGRLVVLFNGEIYNFESLRRELSRTMSFRTNCDTEVLLNLCAQNPGHPERWLRQLNGIFAIAIWDTRHRRLLLARDPYGVKPLHVAQHKNDFFFSSEIKSLLAAGIPSRLNTAALHVFMNIRYVPGQDTLFKGIQRFPAGCYAWVQGGVMEEPVRYYRLPERSHVFEGSRKEACARIRDLFYQAVQRQLLSDVPVGISLSGGLDSSMNVAAADAALRANPDMRAGDHALRTFTIGFNEPTDELDDARCVAGFFGTRHVEQTLTMQALDHLREVIRAVEEPKVNIIQGFMLAKLARTNVKVLLSGLGGDELFAGYDIHRFCNTLGSLHQWTPDWLQNRLLGPAGRLWWNLQNRSGCLKLEHYRIGGQVLLSLGDRAQFYTRLRNAWDEDRGMYARVYARPDEFAALPATKTLFEPFFSSGDNFLEQVLRAEFQTKMMDDFLINEDRVTSAHGVEGRVPFLDRDLVEFAFSVSAREKMQGTQTKGLWKESACAALPNRILRKKKQGFTFSSYHQWDKDLRTAVDRELIQSGWCRETKLFNPDFPSKLLNYPSHPNLRWHYFMAWMMLGIKIWSETFHVEGLDK
jgi:asparagine synthase (glutamine-hydrolysing)